MLPRMLGAIACGACAASAFTLSPLFKSLEVQRYPSYVPSPHQPAATPEHRRSLWVVSRKSSTSNSERLSMRSNSAREEETRGSRREVISGVVEKAMLGAMAITMSSTAMTKPEKAEALGPVKIALVDPEYGSVVCPPKTQVPGEKAGAGLKPVCVKVTVTANNKEKKDIQDAAVFGFVYDEDNTSVVANNPDGASDAGQFAIIDKVPVGSNRVSFQFVAAIEPQEDFDLKKLRFSSLKAISYPGGQRYGAITECEMNPLAEGCDFD